jgi:ABC-type dipeptide/oligopeptide/nickel transport system permease component
MAPSFLARRLTFLLLTVRGISVIAFLAVKVLPGDIVLISCNPKAHECGPAELARTRHELGLDRSLPVQYLAFLKTWIELQPAGWDEAWPAFGNTVSLLFGAVAIEAVLGTAMGFVAALHHRHWQDKAVIGASMVLIAPPTFLFATLFRYFFTYPLGLFGVSAINFSNRFSIDVDPPPFPQTLDLSYWTAHLMWPSLAVATGGIGLTALVTRTALLEIFREDYITAARARGAGERLVIGKHAMKVVAPVILTILIADIGRLLVADALVETVWSWPGIGNLLIGATGARNGPVIVTAAILLTCTIAILATVVDVTHGSLDPRVARSD